MEAPIENIKLLVSNWRNLQMEALIENIKLLVSNYEPMDDPDIFENELDAILKSDKSLEDKLDAAVQLGERVIADVVMAHIKYHTEGAGA